ncbi:MAG: 3-isopropylmalate dehydratase small subunit [bacterium]|nr:3-isopropylmalate dehydratase small subunit [bacterium]
MIKGKVWKFGDDVNTDVIYPGKYLSITADPVEMAKHSFETVYPNFIKEAKPGDIVVGGKFFGCGSSREQAVTCLKHFGIKAIIAESFARIYYRNAINLGLPILVCKGISSKVNQGDIVDIEFETGKIKNTTTGEEMQATPLPAFIMEIINTGGLIPYLRQTAKK